MQLQVDELSFSYGSRPIFTNVSFTAKSGELWHIQGDNGCGKSTLLLTILGMLQPNHGHCRIVDNTNKAHDIRAQASFVPPDANGLWGSLSALENLQYWSELQRPGTKAPLKELSEHLNAWGIQGVLTQQVLRVDRFSTGMKRRLCFARLLQLKTWLWILDEPLFGLDHKGTTQVTKAIQAHLTAGGACLLVTHDPKPFQDLTLNPLVLDQYKPAKTPDLAGGQ